MLAEVRGCVRHASAHAEYQRHHQPDGQHGAAAWLSLSAGGSRMKIEGPQGTRPAEGALSCAQGPHSRGQVLLSSQLVCASQVTAVQQGLYLMVMPTYFRLGP